MDCHTGAIPNLGSRKFGKWWKRVTKTPEKSKHGPRIDRWLLKSEPNVFSWAMMQARGKKGEPWTGVRNYLARNNMRAMKLGDLGFFYHSNEGKEIVGIVRVIALAHPDPGDTTGKWECVDVEAVCGLPAPVTLIAAKANPKLAQMRLVTDTRLSVQPVTALEWAQVCRMGGLDAAKLK